MMQVSTGEFRQNLNEYVDIAQFKEPVTIMQHGKPTVMVMSYEDGLAYLSNKHEQLANEERQFYAEAAQALRDFQQTGLHTTMAEMREWANRLRNNNREPVPVCHK